jgi:hypothetical protein
VTTATIGVTKLCEDPKGTGHLRKKPFPLFVFIGGSGNMMKRFNFTVCSPFGVQSGRILTRIGNRYSRRHLIEVGGSMVV